MMRRTAPVLILAALLGIVFPVPGMAGLFDRTKISAGLGAEFLSRSLKNADSPRLNSTLGTLAVEFNFPSGLDIGLFAGLDRATFNGMTFEELPFSLEYQGGSTSGWIFGGEIRKGFIEFGDFEIGGRRPGVFSSGMDKSYKVFVPGGSTAEDFLYALQRNPNVEYAEPDYRTRFSFGSGYGRINMERALVPYKLTSKRS